MSTELSFKVGPSAILFQPFDFTGMSGVYCNLPATINTPRTLVKNETSNGYFVLPKIHFTDGLGHARQRFSPSRLHLQVFRRCSRLDRMRVGLLHEFSTQIYARLPPAFHATESVSVSTRKSSRIVIIRENHDTMFPCGTTRVIPSQAFPIVRIIGLQNVFRG